MRIVAIALSVCLFSAPAAAQSARQPQASQPSARTGKLAVTVVDPSGAVIPLSTVTVTPQESGAAALAPMTATMEGLAVAENLVPGRYTVSAAFDGFETITAKDVRVRAGDNKHKITLPLKRVDEAVTVGRDKQTSALDPLGSSFSTVLTREQIEALPDDPDEMEAALKAMSPPGSTMRVDGFSGGKLPPKSQIRSIRLPRLDMMAAQNHGGLNGAMFIDIATQPGLGSFRGSTDFTFRDDALNARNPFAAAKGDESLRQGGLSLSGPIKPNQSSYSISFTGGTDYTTSNLLAETLDGTIAEPVRLPSTRSSLNVRLDSAINKDHALRFSYARNEFERKNVGVGGFTLPSAGFRTNSTDHTVRLSENGAVGKRFFSESRLQLRWAESASVSATEAPTIRVNDAFTTGGAQQSGGDHRFEFEAATDLDYVRGKHSMRTGVLVEGGRYRSDASSNYLGTYTFASLADFAAGKPAAYTRRIGDPNVRYDNFQVGVYGQDDWRVHKTALLSVGVRYEAQTLLADQNNFSPRATISWSPFKNGKTTFRGGLGYFNDWLGTQTYEQTLRVDGEKQKELNVLFPSYPDAGLGGITPPANRYSLAERLALPSSWNANVGVDRQITSTFRLNASYTYRRGDGLLRGRNLNAPVNGVRPNATLANDIEVTGDAGSRTHAINVGGNLLAMNWHRTIVFMNYGYTRGQSNAGGAFSLPANGDDLSSEWGPNQPRHRLQGQINTELAKNLSVSVNFRAQSGSPYNLTTGRDDNGDGVFSDRPEGASRNSLWTPGQWDIGGRLSYAMGFGKRPQSAGGGSPQGMMVVIGGGGGGGPQGGFGGGAADKRYQINFYISASNLTNHNNYVGFSGVQTSPFFGHATNVLNPRKVELGMRFGF